ncbi:MAG: hypothetical protein AAGC91_01200, partial [Pseudomonadota bacterium]
MSDQRVKTYSLHAGAREPGRVKRRDKKNISSGVAHINASFNNTMIALPCASVMVI